MNRPTIEGNKLNPITSALAGMYVTDKTIEEMLVSSTSTDTKSEVEIGVAAESVSNSKFLTTIFDGLIPGEYLWTTSFPIGPEIAEGREWKGRPIAPADCPDSPYANAYFCVSSLKIENKEQSRKKQNFSRLFVVVLDDAVGCDLKPTWRLRTSPDKHQIGFLLSTPLDNAEVAERLHKALGMGGRIPADKSGNNHVRYVRLPVCTNTKRTPPFKNELEYFDPNIRIELLELILALGLDADYILGNKSFSASKNTSDSIRDDRQTDVELIRLFMSAETYHEPINKLTARYAQRGLDERAIVDIAQGLMLASDDRSERWQSRFDDIQRTVRDAIRKFAPGPVIDLSCFDEQISSTDSNEDEETVLIKFPTPFRGVMADCVEGALVSAHKCQPGLTILAVLIGMASACSGRYALPDGTRLNLYGCGVVGTGEGKELPRHIAEMICRKGGGTVIGAPSSGAGLEDALVDYDPLLCSMDEAAHFFSAIEGNFMACLASSSRMLRGCTLRVK